MKASVNVTYLVRNGAVAGVMACLSGTLLAAHIDWDGGSSSTNTAVGGSANTAANWSADTVPGLNDDVYLNDVLSLDPVTRTVTLDASLTWKSLTLRQDTAPLSGSSTNKLALASGTILSLTNATLLSTLGTANALAVLELASGSMLAFSNSVLSTATLGTNTVLAGSGVISNSAANITVVLNVHGTLAGPTIKLMNGNRNNLIALGPSAVVTNVQSWSVDHANSVQTLALDNQITNPSQWDNNAVTYHVIGGTAASMEAATSTTSPSTNSNYRFVRINLSSGNLGQAHTIGRFKNNVQNDGGTPGTKEAVYASSWNVQSAGDSSGGHYLLDLNGQDLYVDRFANMTSFGSKAMQFLNSGNNAVSTIRAIDTTGDVLLGGSFAVMNGATLEVVGGTWFDGIYNRSVGDLPADSAAVPNAAAGNDARLVDVTRLWDGIAGGASRYHASFNHFLGSGTDSAGNSGTLYAGTSGSLRIVGGDYVTDGFVLNPLGVTGLLDTTSENASYPDDTLNPVIIRANTWQSVTNLSTVTGVFDSPGHRFTAGTPVQAIGSTQPSGFTATTFYYVVNPTADTFQLAASAGGTPIVPTTTGAGLYVREPNGQGNTTAHPALVVAGQTTIKGHLLMPVVSGAAAVNKGAAVCAPVFQPTLRVGGVLPVTNGLAIDAVTDTLTLSTGAVSANQQVAFSGTTVPGGLVSGQIYYVRDVSGMTFKVAAWPGEPAIDITSAGSAVVLVTPQMSGTAVLTVTGDLLVESRMIDGYIGNSSSSGVNIKVSSVNGDGATVTVTNSLNHGLLPGDVITASGGNVPFRGTFTVANVPTPLVFTYSAAASGAGGTTLAFTYRKSVSANVAIQSNAAVKVAGHVTLGGIGIPQGRLVTGVGVGIDPRSHFTLNGGLSTTQTVSIVAPVGCFHVGEGVGGALSGMAANALLASTLTVAGALDVNGAGVIVGTDAAVGVALTNGAALALGTAASIALAGPFVIGEASTVDLSAGTVSAGALGLASSGIIDFKDRNDVEGALRITGNLRTQLQADIDAGRIRSSRKRLVARYTAAQNETTVVGLSGTLISIL